LPGNCTKKWERFPTTVVEYQENEVTKLLALELPTKKKKKERDLNHVTCFKCNQKGHYSNQCPGKNASKLPWTKMTRGTRRPKERHHKEWPTWK
jgi:hypothetical protein